MPLPSDSKITSGRNGKIAAIVAASVVLLVAYELGVFEQVRDPAALAKSLVAMGAWGYVAFIVTYAAVQPFGVPGTIFVFCAALTFWPWPIAFALSMIGTMAASIIGFSFARFIARDWISSRIPEQFKKYDEALARRALVTVIVMRLIFWMPPLLHAFFRRLQSALLDARLGIAHRLRHPPFSHVLLRSKIVGRHEGHPHLDVDRDGARRCFGRAFRGFRVASIESQSVG